jgi:CHAT domain-containing protein/Tfp pilus assembly protein PilF
VPGRRLAPLLVLPLLTACGPPAEDLDLTPGTVVERAAPQTTHAFRFTAPAGTYLDLLVEQQGVDLVVALHGSEDRALTVVDTPTGRAGTERVRAVTRRSGPHRLEVSAAGAEPGARFALHVLEVRRAEADDRLRSAALAAYFRGEMLRFASDGATLPQAPAHYRRALVLRRRLPDGDPDPVEIHRRLGEVLFALGDLAASQRELQQALAGTSAAERPDVVALLHNQLGRGWRGLGDPQRAERSYRAALAVARGSGDDESAATALGNLAILFDTLGETERALEHFRRARAEWRRLGRADREAAVLRELAGLYTRIGRTEEATDLLQQALAILPDGRPRDRFHLLAAQGWNELIAGHPERALPPLDEALELARELRDPRLEAAALDRRASALHGLGRASEAREGYEQALRRVRAAGAVLDEGHTLLNLGQLALDAGDLDEATTRFRDGLARLAAGGDVHGTVAARVALAEIDRRRGQLAGAQARLEEAIGEIESLRSALVGDLSRSLFLATRYDAYERLTSVLMERHRRRPADGHDRRALEVAESAKARSFLDSLDEAGEEQDAERRRQRLWTRIRAKEALRLELLHRDPADPRAAALEREVRWLLLESERLRGARSGESAEPATLAEIQALLDPETVLLAYALGEDGSHLWRVEPTALASYRLPPRETLDTLARRAARLLARQGQVAGTRQTQATLQALRRAVLPAAALDGLAGRRLVVVPADALLLVPFAVLPDAGGRPLLADHEIVQLPSASVLALQRRRLAGRPPAARELAVLADPVFTAADERLGGEAARSAEPPADLQRAAEDLGMAFPRLPDSAREADSILRLVAPDQRLAATGFAARRDLVVSGALDEFQTLHFATHGLLHPTRPELSGLVLSLLDEQGRPIDGFLRAHEIADLSLPADLVVLSACRTGLGKDIRGEGLVGLPQAFFLAGARTLVVSLWPVGDTATADLMSRFHEIRLRQGISPAAALRQAQLERAAQDPDGPPSTWGGFVVLGDWRR